MREGGRQTIHDGISTVFTSSHSSSLLQVLLKSVNPDGSSTKLTEMTMKVLTHHSFLSQSSHTHTLLYSDSLPCVFTSSSFFPYPQPQCIWKITRQLPQLLSSLNLDHLLYEVHLFFQGYTQLVPSPTPEDTPYRTVKTILFHLTNLVGTEVRVIFLTQPLLQCFFFLMSLSTKYTITLYRYGYVSGRIFRVQLQWNKHFEKG